MHCSRIVREWLTLYKLWHHYSMAESKPTSEQLRREAEELRQTAQRLIEEAARLLSKSSALERQITEHERHQK